MTSLTRRQFLQRSAAAAVALSGLPACADDANDYDLLIARVRFSQPQGVKQYWDLYPGAERALLLEAQRVLRCRFKIPTACDGAAPSRGTAAHFNAIADFADFATVRHQPFCFMQSEGPFNFSDREKQNLRRYIDRGGFLLMDDCVLGKDGDEFYQQSIRLLEELFGPDAVADIPLDHPIYHNVYDLGDQGMPYLQGKKAPGKGVFIRGRLAVVLSANDLHCAWAIATPGDAAYDSCVHVGVNILAYVLAGQA